jgi:hypothetical protein
MKVVAVVFLLWALGSFGMFKFFGTVYIIPYALVTMGVFALAVRLGNRKKA